MIIAVSCFSKRSIVDVWQGSEYAFDSEISQGLWKAQDPDYVSGCNQSSEYARVVQDSEYSWIIPEYTLLWLNMSEYAWIWRSMHEYA